ncbi:DUF4435 domain-containing protein [Vibrio cholerae]|nr:DUF4435 domain-containing protein [Vibrio cholerae]
MLNRNLKARVAKATFYKEYNDIDIFIEDTAHGYKKLFSKLIQRILSPNYKVENVFPLGGRLEVLESCKNDQEPRNRARLFIIDGDLYLLCGETECTELKGLYILPRYCIENHLICTESIISILEQEDPDKNYEELEEGFNYSGWVSLNKDKLIDLYLEYAIAKKIAPSLQTVAFGYSKLISSNSGDVDPVKVGNRISTLKSQIIQISGQDLYDTTRIQISNLIKYDEDSLLRFISGKDMLMPLLMMRSKKLVSFKAPNLSIKLRIADACNLESLSSMPEYIYTV